MLAEKDPIALALFAKYKEITMPNLGLNDADAHAVIDYIDQESHSPKEDKIAPKAPLARSQGER